MIAEIFLDFDKRHIITIELAFGLLGSDLLHKMIIGNHKNSDCH